MANRLDEEQWLRLLASVDATLQRTTTTTTMSTSFSSSSASRRNSAAAQLSMSLQHQQREEAESACETEQLQQRRLEALLRETDEVLAQTVRQRTLSLRTNRGLPSSSSSSSEPRENWGASNPFASGDGADGAVQGKRKEEEREEEEEEEGESSSEGGDSAWASSSFDATALREGEERAASTDTAARASEIPAQAAGSSYAGAVLKRHASAGATPAGRPVARRRVSFSAAKLERSPGVPAAEVQGSDESEEEEEGSESQEGEDEEDDDELRDEQQAEVTFSSQAMPTAEQEAEQAATWGAAEAAVFSQDTMERGRPGRRMSVGRPLPPPPTVVECSPSPPLANGSPDDDATAGGEQAGASAADERRPQQPRPAASPSPTPSSTPSPSPVASPAASSRGSDSPSPAELSPAVLSPAESPQRLHSPVSRNCAAAWGPRGTAAATLARLLLEGGAGAAEEDWDEKSVPPMPQRPAPLLPPLPPQRAPPRAPITADVSLPHGVVRDVDLEESMSRRGSQRSELGSSVHGGESETSTTQFITEMEELLGEGCEFLREALASIPEQEKRQLQKASQAAFVTPVASPLGSMHGLQIPSPTRSVSAGDTTNADAMRLTLRWQVKVERPIYNALTTSAVRVAPSQVFSLRRAGSSTSLNSGSSAYGMGPRRIDVIEPVENIPVPSTRELAAGDILLQADEPLLSASDDPAKSDDRMLLHLSNAGDVLGLDALQRLLHTNQQSSLEAKLKGITHEVIITRIPRVKRPDSEESIIFTYNVDTSDANKGQAVAAGVPLLADTLNRVVITLVHGVEKDVTHDLVHSVSLTLDETDVHTAILALSEDYVLAVGVAPELCGNAALRSHLLAFRDTLAFVYGSAEAILLEPDAATELRAHVRLFLLSLAAEARLHTDPSWVACQPMWTRAHSANSLPAGLQANIPSAISMDIVEACLNMGFSAANMQLQRPNAALTCGTALFHRGIAVHSSIGQSPFRRVTAWLRHLGLLEATATSSSNHPHTVLWHPVFNVDSQPRASEGFALLTIVESRTIFCALSQAWGGGGEALSLDSHQLEQAELVVGLLRNNDILTRLDRALIEPSFPILAKADIRALSAVSHSNVEAVAAAAAFGTRFSVGDGLSNASSAGGAVRSSIYSQNEASEAHSPGHSRNASNASRPDIFGALELPTSPPVAHYEEQQGSRRLSFAGIRRPKVVRRAIHLPAMEAGGAASNTITCGRGNALFHYLAFDAGRGLLLSSETQELHLARTPLQQQLLVNFHRAVKQLRASLQRSPAARRTPSSPQSPFSEDVASDLYLGEHGLHFEVRVGEESGRDHGIRRRAQTTTPRELAAIRGGAAPATMNPAASALAVPHVSKKKRIKAANAPHTGGLPQGAQATLGDRVEGESVLQYWVVGRRQKRKGQDVEDEFYVCFQDGTAQNLVEMSFKLLSGL